MKSTWRMMALSGWLAAAMTTNAAAQEDESGLYLQHFTPATNGTGGIGIDGADLLEPMTPYVGITFDLGSDLLTKQYIDQETGDLVRESIVPYQFITHVAAGFGILPWLDLGLTFPVAAIQQGDFGGPDQAIPGQTPGDLGFTPRFRALDSAANPDLPLSLSLAVPITLPTGDETAYMGHQGVTVTPRLLAGKQYDKLWWGVSLGYKLRKQGQYVYAGFKPVELKNELEAGAAVRYQAFGDLHAILEIQGSTAFIQDASYDEPLEARVGVAMLDKQGLSATVGLGFGLTGGYGTPLWRGVATISYTFGPLELGARDSDEDGIADDDDQCPDQAEDQDGFQDQDGCPDPDNDQDNVLDGDDQCPDKPEDADQYEDEDGCPDPDNDQDGILDTDDQCPNEAEDQDGFEDEDGCPDLDHDQDGILDADDQCPNEPETKNGFQDEDGCPEPDRDEDGVPDEIDKCPKLKEWVNGYKDEDGCPEKDRDKDGIPDGLDKCPKSKETVNGYKDEDGCPERDRDHDGIVDALDKCPKLKEPKNGILDEDGCPDRDIDKDGIPDVLDRCRKKPETVNGYKDEDGCPDTPPASP